MVQYKRTCLFRKLAVRYDRILAEVTNYATKRLGDMLPEAGLITEEQLGEALKYQAQEKERLGTTLVKHNYITEKQLSIHCGSSLASNISISRRWISRRKCPDMYQSLAKILSRQPRTTTRMET